MKDTTLTRAAIFFGMLVGAIGMFLVIAFIDKPGQHGFDRGVIAAAKGEYVATHVVLPDGSERWIVTKAKQRLYLNTIADILIHAAGEIME